MARQRRREDIAAAEETPSGRWRLSRTISLDSVIVFIVSIVSGLVFVLTMNAKIEQQQVNLTNVQKLVERIETDQKERMSRLERDNAERAARLERDNAERATRLEAAIEKQRQLFQDLLPSLRR